MDCAGQLHEIDVETIFLENPSVFGDKEGKKGKAESRIADPDFL